MPFLKIPKGTKVQLLELEKEFYKIQHRNMVGYVKKDLVKVVESESETVPEEPEVVSQSGEVIPDHRAAEPEKEAYPTVGEPRYSLTTATSLRKEPHSKSRVILRFQPGDQVQVLEAVDTHWWKVKYRGQVGWAKRSLLKRE